MTIALCCFYEAYPPASGAATVTWNLAKFTRGKRLLVQLGRRSAQGQLLDGLRISTVANTAETRVTKITGLARRIRAIVDEVQRANCDVIILEGGSWALYHFLLLRGLRRALPHARIIYHSHNVERLLRTERSGRALGALTGWAERSLLREADLSTAVSPIDQEHFDRLYGVRPTLLPNGVDFDRFSDVPARAIGDTRARHGLDTHTVLFSGFYAYPPNREAIDFLVNVVMPALREQFSSATLALTGGGAPYHEAWIRNVGLVPYEDLPAFMASCGVAVAPIFSGSGTRLKILEAMAAGIPVVATEKAAEGLALNDREDILFASDKDEFVRRLSELFENPELFSTLRQSAQRKVKATFSWESILEDFDRVFLTSRGP
jgi:glycosyltransferase involved in cell wall biosynthesis